MIFVYFSLVFFTYVLSILIAVFLEYPFRTMGKVVFSPPKKILRLNRDLARELNTNFVDNIFNDDYIDEDESKRKGDNTGEYTDDDFNEDDDNDGMQKQNRKRQKSQASSQVDLSQYHNTKDNRDDSMSGGIPIFGGGNKMNINQTYTASNISSGNNVKVEDYSDRE
jgi:hypothetical protein